MAAAVLGATVVYGWHTHNVTLLQIHPSFVPMQYNTALGFVGCAAVLLGLLFEWRPLVWAGGAGLLLIGPLTLAQYFFGVDLGIDQWFMRHYLTTLSSAPGRMAPNTALCFTLVGAFALIAMRPASPQRGFALMVLASFVIGLASVAVAGYVVGYRDRIRLAQSHAHGAAYFDWIPGGRRRRRDVGGDQRCVMAGPQAAACDWVRHDFSDRDFVAIG